VCLGNRLHLLILTNPLVHDQALLDPDVPHAGRLEPVLLPGGESRASLETDRPGEESIRYPLSVKVQKFQD
jgi:hypothetical protein